MGFRLQFVDLRSVCGGGGGNESPNLPLAYAHGISDVFFKLLCAILSLCCKYKPTYMYTGLEKSLTSSLVVSSYSTKSLLKYPCKNSLADDKK